MCGGIWVGIVYDGMDFGWERGYRFMSIG